VLLEAFGIHHRCSLPVASGCATRTARGRRRGTGPEADALCRRAGQRARNYASRTARGRERRRKPVSGESEVAA